MRQLTIKLDEKDVTRESCPVGYTYTLQGDIEILIQPLEKIIVKLDMVTNHRLRGYIKNLERGVDTQIMSDTNDRYRYIVLINFLDDRPVTLVSGDILFIEEFVF